MKPNDPWRDGDGDNQIGFIKKVLRGTNSNVYLLIFTIPLYYSEQFTRKYFV